jgi:transcriptional regulator
MYSPGPFIIKDPEYIRDFIAQYPFAILFSNDGHITHLPINRFSDGRFYAHCARANPHASLDDGTAITAVFSGPQAYISPNYYVTGFNVPTWNYSTVHCHATISYINDEAESWRLFCEMVTLYEGSDDWHLPDEQRYRNLLGSIRFFELCNPEFEAKLKFNQNKSGEDIYSVISNLQKINPEAASLMRIANKGVLADTLMQSDETE